MIYALTTLSLLPHRMKAVAPRLAETYANFSKYGNTIGCFACEFGKLQRFMFLTSYDDEEAVARDSAFGMTSPDRYGIGEHLGTAESVVVRPMSFSMPIESGRHGPFYEIRTYTVLPNGLDTVAAAWSKVIERRNEISPALLVASSINDVPTRLIHIWPYASLEERAAARAQAVKEGIWPPPGGGEAIGSLQSELFTPMPFSDLK